MMFYIKKVNSKTRFSKLEIKIFERCVCSPDYTDKCQNLQISAKIYR